MLEMKITITAPDLAAALNNLAAAMNNGSSTAPAEKQAVPVASVPVAQPAAVPVNPNPTPASTANPTAPAIQQTVTPATTPVTANTVLTVPTAAPTFTLEAIATAGTALVDAGKMDMLMGLLAKYNIDSITSLNPSQYGAFATELRALGAQI